MIVWQSLHFYDYGAHFFRIALAVGFALIGVVLWGSVAGSMLPFLLRRCGLDPAASSAPFVATLVDVTGLLIWSLSATPSFLKVMASQGDMLVVCDGCGAVICAARA